MRTQRALFVATLAVVALGLIYSVLIALVQR
ncbi:hypothetical protein HNR08_000060 [Cellulomonas hominis]|uniref:Uncharacterized protein n=1 Tax=Cellulomonas hominis TaxID=156981 RepID=A0A7W8SBR9_9CELL|nr:hypothetical protein [Cellulomonas hominis]